MSSDRHPVRHREIGRLGGCLWLFLAAGAYLVLAGALGIGIDVSPMVAPLVLPPLGLAMMVFVGGRSPVILCLSAIAALAYAGLGVGNYLRVDEFERLTQGPSTTQAMRFRDHSS